MPLSTATGHLLASRPTFLLLVHPGLINLHHLINHPIHPMPIRLVLPVLRANPKGCHLQILVASTGVRVALVESGPS